MKLWLLTRNDEWGYDNYDSAIVAAETEDEAKVAPVGGKPWTPEYQWNPWASPANIAATYIGEAAATVIPGVILASFNAG